MSFDRFCLNRICWQENLSTRPFGCFWLPQRTDCYCKLSSQPSVFEIEDTDSSEGFIIFYLHALGGQLIFIIEERKKWHPVPGASIINIKFILLHTTTDIRGTDHVPFQLFVGGKLSVRLLLETRQGLSIFNTRFFAVPSRKLLVTQAGIHLQFPTAFCCLFLISL